MSAMRRLLAIVLMLSAAAAAQQARKPARRNVLPQRAESRAPELLSEPHHRKLYEDADVRVFVLELPPGASTRRHWHELPSLTVALEDADISISGKITPGRMQLGPGQVQVGKGGAEQEEKNEAAQPLRALVIELKHGLGEDDVLCGLDQPPCKGAYVGGELKVGTYAVSPLFETRDLKLAETTIDPGVSVTREAHNGGYLRIPITPGRVAETVDGGEPFDSAMRPGTIVAVVPGRSTLTNRGDQVLRFLTLECKHP